MEYKAVLSSYKVLTYFTNHWMIKPTIFIFLCKLYITFNYIAFKKNNEAYILLRNEYLKQENRGLLITLVWLNGNREAAHINISK